MSLRVVDGLEVIEVDEQEADPLRLTSTVRHRVVHAITEQRAIGEARQRIVERLVQQFGLEFLAPGHVLHDGDQAKVAASLSAQDNMSEPHASLPSGWTKRASRVALLPTSGQHLDDQ